MKKVLPILMLILSIGLHAQYFTGFEIPEENEGAPCYDEDGGVENYAFEFGCVEDWFSSHGSPDVSDNIFFEGNSSAHFWLGNASGDYSEGIYMDFDFVQDNYYILKLRTFALFNIVSGVGVECILTNELTPHTYDANLSQIENYGRPELNEDHEVIWTNNTYNYPNWLDVEVPFEPMSDYSQIWLTGRTEQTGYDSSKSCWFDEFEIIDCGNQDDDSFDYSYNQENGNVEIEVESLYGSTGMQFFRLYRMNGNSTSDFDIIEEIDSWNTASFSYTDYEFDPEFCYMIKHEIYPNTGCPPIENRVSFCVATISPLDNCLNFDGENDYVSFKKLIPAIKGLNEFSIEFWMAGLYSAQSERGGAMFSIDAKSSNSFGYMDRLTFYVGSGGFFNQKLVIVSNNELSQNVYVSKTPIGDGDCHHIAYTYHDGHARVYIDGIHEDDIQFTVNIKKKDVASLGQSYEVFDKAKFYDGLLDDLRIWKSYRTEAEILANMEDEYTDASSDMIAYYDFNQGIPGGINSGVNTLIDGTSNGINGGLFNFSLSGFQSNWIADECNVAPLPKSRQSMELEQKSFDLYPNPSTGLVFFEMQEKVEADMVVNVFRSDGSLARDIILKKGTSKVELNLQDQIAGLYFIQLNDGNQTISRKIILK